MQKVVIIGGGVSGLTAGIFALKQGYDVTIYEKGNQAGGNLTSWTRDNITIDGCIHWLTGTNENTSTYKLWKQVEAFKDQDILKLDRLFTNYRNGKTATLFRDIDKTEKQLILLSPEDEKEIKSFILATKLTKYFLGVGGVNNNKKASFKEFFKYLPLLIKYYNLSLLDLSKKFKNKTISGLFTNFIGGKFSSLALLITYANFVGGNADLIKGGSKVMANNLVKYFLAIGGKLILKNGVKKANIENDKVVSVILDDNSTVYLDYLIATGDAKFIYNDLLNVTMPKQLKRWYNFEEDLLFSSIGIAFKVDKNKVPFNVDCAFSIPLKYQSLLRTKSINLREYSYDEAFIEKDKTVIQSLTFLNELDCLKLINLRKNYTQYKIEKERICNLYKDCIEEILPALKGHIKVIDCWTPATYKRYNYSKIGSWMSFIVPKKTIPLNCPNVVKGVKNVIIASQWLTAPGGLPICVEQAKKAVKTLLKLSKKQKFGRVKWQTIKSNN